MKTASRLFTLTAADLMSREVIALRDDDSLDRSAQLFAREQIGGTPVVDSEGRCVGHSRTWCAGPRCKEASPWLAPRRCPGPARFRRPIAIALGRK
jgi:hypothetical protein